MVHAVGSFYAMLGFIGLIVSNAAALKEPLTFVAGYFKLASLLIRYVDLLVL